MPIRRNVSIKNSRTRRLKWVKNTRHKWDRSNCKVLIDNNFKFLLQVYCFFISRLFEENEDILELFEKFKHLKSREERETSEELKEHATTVMTTLDESIMSLDNADYCIDYLKNVGRTHTKIKGFKAEYFWVRLGKWMYLSLSLSSLVYY